MQGSEILRQKLIDRMAQLPTGCWFWLRACNNTGYGQLWDGLRLRQAHWLSFKAFVGPIPENMKVCHTCDVRECINPDHLFLGTQKDNMQDCIAKGRRASTNGENNGRAVLTWGIVDKIRADIRDGDSQQRIAEKYGITVVQVSRIKLHKLWRKDEDHVPDHK